ncbi:hypothetical protein CEXT_781641 [Caerostris extrusa]|uniref:Uncharacterized protein n=1 Tax=Caerostris extrusa TaxID=172846 RepID=A0AAV4WFP6_CAEEX|nr:hypothetical protein CEXT_781641 [Caerostris extrusa]
MCSAIRGHWLPEEHPGTLQILSTVVYHVYLGFILLAMDRNGIETVVKKLHGSGVCGDTAEGCVSLSVTMYVYVTIYSHTGTSPRAYCIAFLQPSPLYNQLIGHYPLE